MARNRFATFGTVWTFRTKRFRVSLELQRDNFYRYDGDDENGETQAALNSGEFVAFDSKVTVEFDGEEIAANYLGGSVYGADNVADFYTDHRSADPLNRNCTIMRKAWRGEGNPDAKVSICHYFPGMVQEAISAAREAMIERKREAASLPYIRGA
jgi:hypothetical protein